jgi:excinuclease ABC subunit A
MQYFQGLNDFFKELEEKNYKIQNRVMLSRYRGKTKCYSCKGKRLRIEASYVKIEGKTISDLVDLPIRKLTAFFEDLSLTAFDEKVAKTTC